MDGVYVHWSVYTCRKSGALYPRPLHSTGEYYSRGPQPEIEEEI